jgi:multidrug efflux pump subunit AcrA (membrane-fusion protein)
MNVMPQDPSFGEEQQNRSLEKRRRRMARIIGLCAVIGLAALVGFGIWTQSSRKADANAVLAAQKDTVPKVRTIIVKDATAPRTIELPANMAAFDSATLYARATGYIGKRNVDIGSKVHKGDVLAVISAPSSRSSRRRSTRRRQPPSSAR